MSNIWLISGWLFKIERTASADGTVDGRLPTARGPRMAPGVAFRASPGAFVQGIP